MTLLIHGYTISQPDHESYGDSVALYNYKKTKLANFVRYKLHEQFRGSIKMRHSL